MPSENIRPETRPVSALHPAARNPRVHPAAQVERIAASIRRFGFCAPLLITAAGEIVAGEARWHAAQLVGLARVPVVVLEHLSPAQVEAYRIADNRLAQDAEWDDALLANVVRDLDLALTADEMAAIGFASDELSALLGVVDPIETPALPTHDREPFQRVSFVLHDSQADLVDRALAKAKKAGRFDDAPNANGNGNALARICAAYVE